MSDFLEIAALEGDLDLAHAAARSAERQRDQLLEAIEAHRAEKAHGRTANMELVDDRLYALADQIKSKEGVPEQPETAGAPKKCRCDSQDQKLRELLEWVEAESTKLAGLERFEPVARRYAFNDAIDRIHSLLSSDEEGR